jgi:hypothetical protein
VRFSILIYLCIILFVFLRPRVLYGHAFVAAALDPPQAPRGEERELWQSFKTSDGVEPPATVDEDIHAAVFYSDGVRLRELSNHLLIVMVDQMRHHHKWNGVLV